jgi:hypothetical protein
MESARRRARRDTREACDTLRFQALEVVATGITGVAAALLVADPKTPGLVKVLIGFAGAVAGFLAVIAVIFVRSLVLAPVRQRDEARQVIDGIRSEQERASGRAANKARAAALSVISELEDMARRLDRDLEAGGDDSRYPHFHDERRFPEWQNNKDALVKQLEFAEAYRACHLAYASADRLIYDAATYRGSVPGLKRGQDLRREIAVAIERLATVLDAQKDAP